MKSPRKSMASARMLFALLSGTCLAAGFSHAQVLSNATGGGSWSSGSTWTGGLVPTNAQSWTIRAGDTVTAASGVNYSSTQNPVIQGTLTVGTGASFQVNRLNSSATTGSGTLYLSGGTFTASRLLGSAAVTAHLTSGGALTVVDSSAISAGYVINVGNGGTFTSNAAFFTGAQLNLSTGGTIVQKPGMASSVLTNAAVTWNGGTLVTNTTGFVYSGSTLTKLLTTWSGDAANTLTLSNQTTAQTLNLGANTGTIGQGRLVFTVYAPTNNGSDKVVQAANTSTALTSGVRLILENPGTAGPASNYVGKSYQLFTTSGSGSYASINPTVEPTIWNIGGVDYSITWTNTLSTNGTLTVAAVTPAVPIHVSDFNLPPQNAAGWTILAPVSDSRLIYIDNTSGNDTTATYYAPGAPNIGSNPQAPTGAVLAYKTLAAAAAVLREDKPDWLLLKSGSVWTGQSLDVKRGRSPSERAVVCAYGTGARPELRTGASRGILDAQISNIIITGIKFWAHTRDSDGPYFTGYAGEQGFSLVTRSAGDVRQVRDVLIEDCVFRSYTNNTLSGQTAVGEPITRFVIRRSLISGNYSTTAHAQGLYHAGDGQIVQPSVLVQENTFDHNGWRIQSVLGDHSKTDGQATMFNHNTYFSGANGVILEKNLFLRASSIGTKWTANYGEGSSKVIIIDNNLYVEGEVGASIGGNYDGPRRFQNVRFSNNVLTDMGRSRPTNRYLAWYLDVIDWKDGQVVDNLMIHQRNTSILNTYGMTFTTQSASSGTDDVLVAGNIVANLRGGTQDAMVRFEFGNLTNNLVFEDNIVQTPTASPVARYVTGGFDFSGVNQYHSAASASNRFQVNGAFTNLAGWTTATGDTGAIDTAPSFPAATRDVEGYAASLGLGGTFQSFINAVYGQSKANWNPALTAPAVNNWLRAGFGMPAVN